MLSFLNYRILTNLPYILSCYLNNFVGRCSGTALKSQHSGPEDHGKFKAGLLSHKKEYRPKENKPKF